MQPVNANWCLSMNFGDLLAPYLIEKITGQKPFWLDLKNGEMKVVTVGSILSWCDASCIVWGAGISQLDGTVNRDTIIRAVRGPISMEAVKGSGADCPDVMGDPAILLPMFYKPKQTERKGLGIIPHYIEQELAWTTIDEKADVKFINVFDPVEKVIDDICSCEAVLSSSLHGLIVADVYGIPSRWLTISNQIHGDGTKYFDYYRSIGINGMKAAQFFDLMKKDTADIIRETRRNEVTLDADKLFNAKPF